MRYGAAGLPLALASCLSGVSTVGVGDGQQAGHATTSVRGSSAGHSTSSHSGSSAGSSSSGSGSSGGGTGSSSSSGTGGASGTGSTGSGGSTTSSGSSSGGGSTSSSGPGDGGCTDSYLYIAETACQPQFVCPALPQCPDGLSFSSQFVDYLNCNVIAGAVVAAVSADGTPFEGASANTASNGAFGLCLPSDAPFTIQLTAPSYPTTFAAEVSASDGGAGFGQVPGISNAEIQEFGAVLGISAAGKGLIVAKVVADTCAPDIAGWTFTLSLPDGGAVPDGGSQAVYLSENFLPDPTATATSSKGAALFSDVDPSFSSYYVVTAANPDAGSCQPMNAAFGFTGRVFVQADAVSFDPILLP